MVGAVEVEAADGSVAEPHSLYRSSTASQPSAIHEAAVGRPWQHRACTGPVMLVAEGGMYAYSPSKGEHTTGPVAPLEPNRTARCCGRPRGRFFRRGSSPMGGGQSLCHVAQKCWPVGSGGRCGAGHTRQHKASIASCCWWVVADCREHRSSLRRVGTAQACFVGAQGVDGEAIAAGAAAVLREELPRRHALDGQVEGEALQRLRRRFARDNARL